MRKNKKGNKKVSKKVESEPSLKEKLLIYERRFGKVHSFTTDFEEKQFNNNRSSGFNDSVNENEKTHSEIPSNSTSLELNLYKQIDEKTNDLRKEIKVDINDLRTSTSNDIKSIKDDYLSFKWTKVIIGLLIGGLTIVGGLVTYIYKDYKDGINSKIDSININIKKFHSVEDIKEVEKVNLNKDSTVNNND